MFKIILLLFSVCATCLGDVPAIPPADNRVYCAQTPTEILSCIGNPRIISSEATQSCQKPSVPCDKYTCIFRNLGFMKGTAVDKTKVIAYFDSFAEAHPEWAPAVQLTKTTCLAGDLPPQGVYLSCPAYDITMCSLASFFRGAQPSQWSTAPGCQYSRQYAGACPVCPDQCFAPQVPYGSCNACLSMPRSP